MLRTICATDGDEDLQPNLDIADEYTDCALAISPVSLQKQSRTKNDFVAMLQQ